MRPNPLFANESSYHQDLWLCWKHHRESNVGGSVTNTMSLAQLSAWCATRFGPREIAADLIPRPFDIPGMVLDTARAAKEWHCQIETPLEGILDKIVEHAAKRPNWLDLTAS